MVLLCICPLAPILKIFLLCAKRTHSQRFLFYHPPLTLHKCRWAVVYHVVILYMEDGVEVVYNIIHSTTACIGPRGGKVVVRKGC